MPTIRVLESPARPMQRLGYLKYLARRVTTLNTSNLENLGNDLLDTVSKKVRVPLNEERADYIKKRLYDRAYKTLKETANAWSTSETPADLPPVSMELQDLYLADPALPSQVGKLVKGDWRKYPPLGIGLGFIRAGTYSANTRALSLLYFTPAEEWQAFREYKPEANPLCLDARQSLLMLYAFLDNDGEVIAPLWAQLQDRPPFTDRDVGDRLPDFYRQITARHRRHSLPVDERNRLQLLEQSADSIARWQSAERYAGGAREEASRPRVEPYVDMGILAKPDPFKYEYTFSPMGEVWVAAFAGERTSQEVADFLRSHFFSTAARAHALDARPITDPEEVVPYLYRASGNIRSPGGYAPIEELALVAGIEALLDDHLIIEPAVAREALIAYQKAHPYDVRFTVDRLGTLAHARFLEAPAVPVAQP